MSNSKDKKLSEVTVEEFENIMDKLADRLIYGLQNLEYKISRENTYRYVENRPHAPNQYEVWCNSRNFSDGEVYNE